MSTPIGKPRREINEPAPIEVPEWVPDTLPVEEPERVPAAP